MDFGAVRALVVLPELPVAGGAVGGVASVLPEVDWRVLSVVSFVLPDEFFVRGLVVLPEFVAAVGSFGEFAVVELEALPESFDASFGFLFLAIPVLPSPAAGASPVGGVALADGSAAALFSGLLVAVGVVFAFSPYFHGCPPATGEIAAPSLFPLEPLICTRGPSMRRWVG
jgi:hypothetical protein